MEYPLDFPVMDNLLQEYVVFDSIALGKDNRKKLITAANEPSMVDRFSESMEILYALRDKLDDTGFTIVAQLANFLSSYSFHGINEDSRGSRIVLAMRKELGEEAPLGGWPTEEDPQPKPEILTLLGITPIIPAAPPPSAPPATEPAPPPATEPAPPPATEPIPGE